MKITPTAKICTMAFSVLVLASCATGGGTATVAQADQYERTIPICVNANDCTEKMAAAKRWVVNNTGYALLIDSDEVIETHGWGRADITAVRVEKTPIGGGRHSILVELSCAAETAGPTFGSNACPPYWETVLDFNVAVSSAAQ
jgi:hypothetical protein